MSVLKINNKYKIDKTDLVYVLVGIDSVDMETVFLKRISDLDDGASYHIKCHISELLPIFNERQKKENIWKNL